MSDPVDKAHHAYQQVSRFGSLDGVRFLAIGAVLWHHSPLMERYGDTVKLASRGFVGVDLFFVLSGFLITTLLLREESAKGRFSLAGFYWRRVLRIIPVYFLVVTLAAIYFIGIKGQGALLELLPYYYLFLANFLVEDIPLLDPMWSLAVEEQYYLVWPLALMLVPRRWVLPALAVLVVLNVLGGGGHLSALGITGWDWGPLRIALPNATYAPILMGSALAVILHSGRGFRLMSGLCSARWAAPVWLGAIVVALVALPADLLGWPNMVLHLVMTLALAALVMREDHALAGLMRAAPVARIGQVSYGIYLYHLFALHIVNRVLGHDNGWLVFLGYAILSVLIAEISFRVFESRFLALRR